MVEGSVDEPVLGLKSLTPGPFPGLRCLSCRPNSEGSQHGNRAWHFVPVGPRLGPFFWHVGKRAGTVAGSSLRAEGQHLVQRKARVPTDRYLSPMY